MTQHLGLAEVLVWLVYLRLENILDMINELEKEKLLEKLEEAIYTCYETDYSGNVYGISTKQKLDNLKSLLKDIIEIIGTNKE